MNLADLTLALRCGRTLIPYVWTVDWGQTLTVQPLLVHQDTQSMMGERSLVSQRHCKERSILSETNNQHCF